MRTSGRFRLLLALLLIFGLVAAACGDDDDEGGDETDHDRGRGRRRRRGGRTRGDDRHHAAHRPRQRVHDRLLEVDPELGDFNYAAESYDAVVVISLAAVLADDDGIDHASQINGVTRGGEKCDAPQACFDLIEGGTTDIDYDGISGDLEFSGNGEPTVASYGKLSFGDDNRIDDDATEFIEATAPEEADVPEVPVERPSGPETAR